MEMMGGFTLKIFKQIACVIFICFTVLFLFLKLWVPLGSKANKQRQKEYQKRAKNYQNNKFENTKPFQMIYKVEKGQKNHFLSQKKAVPQDKIPVQKPIVLNKINKETLSVTWLGHA